MELPEIMHGNASQSKASCEAVVEHLPTRRKAGGQGEGGRGRKSRLLTCRLAAGLLEERGCTDAVPERRSVAVAPNLLAGRCSCAGAEGDGRRCRAGAATAVTFPVATAGGADKVVTDGGAGSTAPEGGSGDDARSCCSTGAAAAPPAAAAGWRGRLAAVTLGAGAGAAAAAGAAAGAEASGPACALWLAAGLSAGGSAALATPDVEGAAALSSGGGGPAAVRASAMRRTLGWAAEGPALECCAAAAPAPAGQHAAGSAAAASPAAATAALAVLPPFSLGRAVGLASSGLACKPCSSWTSSGGTTRRCTCGRRRRRQ